MNIRDVLNNLPEKEKKQILYAFENHIVQYIELAGNTFIGVNVINVPHLSITESVGAWSIGIIKKEINNG